MVRDWHTLEPMAYTLTNLTRTESEAESPSSTNPGAVMVVLQDQVNPQIQ